MEVPETIRFNICCRSMVFLFIYFFLFPSFSVLSLFLSLVEFTCFFFFFSNIG